MKGQTLTDAIRQAVEHEYERERARISLIQRLKPLQDQFSALARPGGQPADKASFDDLSGDS